MAIKEGEANWAQAVAQKTGKVAKKDTNAALKERISAAKNPSGTVETTGEETK